MAELPAERNNIYEEETRFKAAVSEAVGQKLGKSINFINMRQFDQQEATAAGRYGEVIAALVAAGSASYPFEFCKRYVAPVNMEIMGIAIQTGTVGSSSTTTFDIHLISANGATDDGTVFSVKPAVTSAATSNRFGGYFYDPVDGSTVTFGSTPTGVTLGTFSSLPFPVDQGEALRFDIDAVMAGTPQGISLTLFMRPR